MTASVTAIYQATAVSSEITTRKLYLDSDAISHTSEVLSCKPYGSQYVLQLNETLFHSQGGGQLSDRGVIGDVAVEKVFEIEAEVLHLVNKPVAPGQYRITLDSEWRELNARLHSAGHLIAHIFIEQGITPLKGHHWPGESFVAFNCQSEDVNINVEQLQTLVNEYIQRGMERTLKYNAEGKRFIGFGYFKAFPCGGTHVKNINDIGSIKIKYIKFKKGAMKISYDVG